MLAEFNASHLEHFMIGIGIQLLLWLFFSRWAAGGMAVAVFLGREIAQHEYKGGGGNVVPWYYGLLNHWTVDSLLDVAAPLAGCLLVALATAWWQRWRMEKTGHDAYGKQ